MGNLDFTPGIYESVTGESYHADIWGSRESPTFSRTIAHKIYSQSPLAAYAAHPHLGGRRQNGDEDEYEEGEAFGAEERDEDRDQGSIYHELILGGASQIVVLDYDNFRTKKAREDRDAAIQAGKIPIPEAKWRPIRENADEMKKALWREGVDLADSDRELTALWYHKAWDNKIPCKCRFDLFRHGDGRVLISDLKIRKRLNVAAFSRSLEWYGLDMQAYAYTAATETLLPKMAGRVSYQFVLLEKSSPFDCAVLPVSKALLEMGRLKWEIAIAMWQKCLASGEWPGAGRAEPLMPSSYALAETARRYIEMFGPDSLPEIGGDE